jgi:hypothetical protein
MNPQYEPRRELSQLLKDLQARALMIMYPELTVDLATTFAMLQLKRGCKR